MEKSFEKEQTVVIQPLLQEAAGLKSEYDVYASGNAVWNLANRITEWKKRTVTFRLMNEETCPSDEFMTECLIPFKEIDFQLWNIWNALVSKSNSRGRS
jgi:hypothetical protein